MKRQFDFVTAFVVLVGCMCVGISAPQSGAENSSAVVPQSQSNTSWPQVLSQNGYTYTIGMPSVVSMNGSAVTMKASFNVTQPDGIQNNGTMTIMGFTATGDRPADIELNQLMVMQVQLPNGGDVAAAQTALGTLTNGLAVNLHRKAIAQQMTINPITTQGLGNQMPEIVQRDVPTVLISVAGEPQLAPLPGAMVQGWRRTTNTPFILLQDPSKVWFVRLGQSNWRSSQTLAGPWVGAAAPDASVMQAMGAAPTPPRGLTSTSIKDAVTPTAPIDILVATKPTVLISSNGAPVFNMVCDGVQQMTNTNSTFLRTTMPAADWVLASGRWFERMQGMTAWQFVPPNQLPPSFANLPASGSLTAARASVPGTIEAKCAILSASQTQTVTLLRAKAICNLKYTGSQESQAGTPQFAPIAGTNLQYSTNSSAPVIFLPDSQWFCCDDAAWFMAASATGPWTLCDTLPASFANIPATSPVYCVTYVTPISSTTDSVTFAYTNGYLGTYLNDGTAVFGTGNQYATTNLANGQSQTYPQTYGSDNQYDEDTGTYAPDYDYYNEYPAVQPYVYGYGYDGWGYSSAWSQAWGWGVADRSWWNNDNWNNFYPYGDRWNNGYSAWQVDQNNLAAARRIDGLNGIGGVGGVDGVGRVGGVGGVDGVGRVGGVGGVDGVGRAGGVGGVGGVGRAGGVGGVNGMSGFHPQYRNNNNNNNRGNNAMNQPRPQGQADNFGGGNRGGAGGRGR